MALENYNLYYRKFVIWKEQQLINPRLFDLSAFTFSKNSVLHYLGTPQDPFLLPNSPVLSSISNNLYTEVITQYSPDRNLGKPRTLNRTITSTISSYYTKNMRIKHFDGINSVKGENDLIMYNYSMIDDGYNYNSQRGGEMMRWLNLYGTIFDNIAACAKQSTRMQVLFLDLPVTIPSPTLLEQTGKTGLIPSYYTRLNTHDHWLVTELWNLIMGRPQTLFVKFEDNLEWFNRLNLVFTHNGKYFILNLGFLLGLGKRHNGDFENLKVAKRLINLFLTTKEATAIVNLDDDDDDIEDSSKSDNELDYDRSDEEDDDITDIVKNAKVDDSPFDIRDPLAEMYNNNMTNEPAANKLPNMNLTDDSDLADDSESIDDDIDAKLAELEKVDDAKPLALDEDSYSVDDVYHEYVPPADDLDSAIETISQNYAKAGVLTSGEVNRMKKISQRYKTLPDPYGGNNNYKDYLNITQEELKITQDDNDVILGKDVKGVIDDSMTKSTLNKFDRQYIRTTLRKDLISSVMQLQKNGIAVADHKVERITNYMDDYEEHTVKLVPVVGSPSTVRFKVPVVKDDGTFKAKGVKYRLRKQKADLPIRKVAPNEVSLTSYYSKLFITRTERKQFDYTDWVTKNIIALSIGETPTVFGLSLNSVHDPNIKGLPRAYTAIASKVAQFTFGKMTFNFNIHRVDKFNKTGIDEYKGYVPVGKHGNKELLMKVSNNVIYELNGVKFDALGTIEQIIGLGQPPLDLIEVSLFGKKVPLVIIIAYHLGLGNLLKTLKIKHQVHPRNVRTQVPEGWRQINFNDYKLFFDGSDYAKAMLINGFNRYKTLLASMNYYAFDKKDVYSGLIGEAGLPMSVLKEVPLLFNLWVDHITKDILIEMGEPTDLFNLFLRACELLTTDDHPDETDDAYMRIRGYERFSGLVYGEMIRAMRGYGSKAVIQNAKVELNPEAVWYSIMNDEAMIICEESNPIHELKEQEIIVFRGQGGRSSLSMTMKSRKYNKNGIGIISEATVDSGETGTITYLTANPNFKSVRGLGVITGDTNKVDPAQKQSTSMCLAPGSLTDDPRRVGFIAVQNSQSTFMRDAVTLPVRTGMENVLAKRTGSTFAKACELDGVVKSVTDKGITIEYVDGTTESAVLGRVFGRWAGDILPHDIITTLKEGDKVKKGDIYCYNQLYFQPDRFNKNNVVFKNGILARTVMVECNEVFEDSCVLSSQTAEKLMTAKTYTRSITVTADQAINDLVKIGTVVYPDSILCTIVNHQSDTGFFNEEALASLKSVGSLNPKAKYAGTVERIEVIYSADIEEMTESLQQIVNQSDKELHKTAKSLGQKTLTGYVIPGTNIEGNRTTNQTVIMKFYITKGITHGVGDKVVFSNQLKSTVSRVWHDEQTTEKDNKPFDAFFSYISIDNRVVRSVDLIGSTSTLCVRLGELALAAYDS